MRAHFWEAVVTQDLTDQQAMLAALVRLIDLREAHLQPEQSLGLPRPGP